MSRLVLAAAFVAVQLGCATSATSSSPARQAGAGSGVPERKYVCQMERSQTPEGQLTGATSGR